AHRRDHARTGRGAARRAVRQAGRALGASVAALARAVPRRGARGARQAGHAARTERAADAGAVVPGRLPQRASLAAPFSRANQASVAPESARGKGKGSAGFARGGGRHVRWEWFSRSWPTTAACIIDV